MGSAAFFLYRFALWFDYKPSHGADSAPLTAELVRAFWMGLRFDLKVMAGCALLLLLAGAIAPRRWRAGVLVSIASLILLLSNLLALINHFYFGFYGSPIDPMIFGVVEDDTAVVFQTVLREFPVFRVLGAWLAATGLQVWLVGWAARSMAPRLAL